MTTNPTASTKSTPQLFDVIVGNPPYVRPHHLSDKQKVYLWKNYEVASQKTDLYAFFIERGIKLLNDGGYLGYIIPKTWFSIHSFKKLRQFVLENTHIVKIGLLPEKVFEDAIVQTVIIILRKKKAGENTADHIITVDDVITKEIIKTIPQKNFLNDTDFNITVEDNQVLQNIVRLGDITEVIVGIATGDDKKYCKFEKTTELDKKAIRGANIARYEVNYTGEYLWYNKEEMVKDSNLKPKTTLKGGGLLCSPKKPSDFEIPAKIFIQRIGVKITAALDINQYYAHTSVIIVKPIEGNFNLKYLLAVINSDYIFGWYKANSSNVSINAGMIKSLPIPNATAAQQAEIATLVDRIMNLKMQYSKYLDNTFKLLEAELASQKPITRAKKLTNFTELDFTAFISELTKQKYTIAPATKRNLLESFEIDRAKLSELQTQTETVDNEIEALVRGLYGVEIDL